MADVIVLRGVEMVIECPFCGEPVETRGRDLHNRDLFVEQTGWSVVRQQGGSNQLSLRKQTGRYAHGRCVRLVSRGIDPINQGRLI